MKFTYKYLIGVMVIITLVVYTRSDIYSWGFYGHKKINRMAVFTLPPEMIGFYKKNIEYITEHAVDPDKRRYAVDGEAQRHYIDIDHYVLPGEDPFEVVPKYWTKAVEKFTEDTLQAYGIAPWHVNVMINRLTRAFEEKNVDKILRYSTELGHYIGDSHVPLHTTENYNGQLTNQKGIHGFWESRIPELKAKDYDYFVGRAVYVENTIDDEWQTIKESFAAKDSVLELEAQLNSTFPTDRKYAFENRGSVVMKTYSEEYTNAYDDLLNGMVERRLTQAIIKVGSYWYTAWVNAGQPDLNALMEKKPSEELIKEDTELDKLFKNNKIKGRDHED